MKMYGVRPHCVFFYANEGGARKGQFVILIRYHMLI